MRLITINCLRAQTFLYQLSLERYVNKHDNMFTCECVPSKWTGSEN